MAQKKLQCVKVEKKGGIAWVWLNRPEKRNAMSPRCDMTVTVPSNCEPSGVMRRWTVRSV